MQLNLSRNQIGSQGAQYISQALQNNTVRPNQFLYLHRIFNF